MAKIACFVEKYNFSDPREEVALQTFKRTAETMGHQFNFMFRESISEIPRYDAMFIRATTDPLFTAYVVSKTAAVLGLRVIDDPESIQICANKIHQYALFKKTQYSTHTNEIHQQRRFPSQTATADFQGIRKTSRSESAVHKFL